LIERLDEGKFHVGSAGPKDNGHQGCECDQQDATHHCHLQESKGPIK